MFQTPGSLPGERPDAALPITVAIPTKNEAANLARCLERLHRFAEVVVIDSGSTDGTLDIARSFDARIVNFVWDGRYPKKRNWFLLNDPPEQPWVLFLDADEYVDEEFCRELAMKIEDARVDGFWLTYTNYFLDKPLRHGIAQRKLALFRVGKALYEKIDEDQWSSFDMEIHEHPIVDGDVGTISSRIEHRDFSGIARFVEKHRRYAQWEAERYFKLESEREAAHLTPRQKFKYRHLPKWWYPWFYFVAQYFARLGFLDGGAGFHYAAYKSWYFQTIRLLISEKRRGDRRKSKSV